MLPTILEYKIGARDENGFPTLNEGFFAHTSGWTLEEMLTSPALVKTFCPADSYFKSVCEKPIREFYESEDRDLTLDIEDGKISITLKKVQMSTS